MTPDIERLQALFQIGEHNPITLRAIHAGKREPVLNYNFLASDFPSVVTRWEAFVEQATALNRQAYNIYTCLNPINEEFQSGAVTDGDIACRRLLLIDLDRADKCNAPASDDEIRSAVLVADDIENWLGDLSDSVPTRIMSGNGIHLYYQMEETRNDIDGRNRVRNLLRDLAERFDTPTIKIDTSVSNASRITKVPGTIARKGVATNERPYREASFL